jgi:predicted  nucleic acid-binding Zn-ribbon protein
VTYFIEYQDQLLALGIIPGALGSEVQALADLKADLDEEKATRVTAQVEADVLFRAVRDLKISTDRLATQIPTLEDKVKHLEDKEVEGLKEVRAQELCMECTTKANDNYQKEVAQLTKRLESKSPDLV